MADYHTGVKIIKIIAFSCVSCAAKYAKNVFALGSLQHSLDPLAGFKEPTSKERGRQGRKGEERGGEGNERGWDG